jgi:hypothetical protein
MSYLSGRARLDDSATNQHSGASLRPTDEDIRPYVVCGIIQVILFQQGIFPARPASQALQCRTLLNFQAITPNTWDVLQGV